jgi:DNA-directed RNA polymerase specialized sigma subunit
MITRSGHEYGSTEWHTAIIEAYFARPVERVVDIAARLEVSQSHVSYLAKRAVKRLEATRTRGKGFQR